jgi:aminoglycoside phosphotransferase (APT) family kinase protein
VTATLELDNEFDETPDDVARSLLAELGDRGELRELRRLASGASRETWSFTHVVDGSEHRLVLRRDPVDRPERHGSMALEVNAIRSADDSGVPVPSVIASGDDFGGTGTGFVITEFVEGESLGPRIVRSPALVGARERFGFECGAILARIHRIDVAHVPGAPRTDPLAELVGLVAGLGSPSAAVGLALRLLLDHSPTEHAEVVTHGDFRNGNLIVDETGIRAVLDWELVHLGHPLDDLGWLCTRAWSFGGPHPVGGIGTYDQLLDGYESVAGSRPGLDDVRWWQLLGSVRWAVACLRAASRFDDGTGRTIDAAALARRSSENELDILHLIDVLRW